MALYDSDTSAGHGDWNGEKGGASDSDDASLDGIASLAAGVPAIGGAGIELALKWLHSPQATNCPTSASLAATRPAHS